MKVNGNFKRYKERKLVLELLDSSSSLSKVVVFVF